MIRQTVDDVLATAIVRGFWKAFMYLIKLDLVGRRKKQ